MVTVLLIAGAHWEMVKLDPIEGRMDFFKTNIGSA